MAHNHRGPMAGRTVLVTGGTEGIGQATALGLAATANANATGHYFANSRARRSSERSYDGAVGARLQVSADLVGVTTGG
jgi:NAD(P)-dependent dehydrogenase (short-subunit alcohol dehydrogenase family)